MTPVLPKLRGGSFNSFGHVGEGDLARQHISVPHGGLRRQDGKNAHPQRPCRKDRAWLNMFQQLGIVVPKVGAENGAMCLPRHLGQRRGAAVKIMVAQPQRVILQLFERCHQRVRFALFGSFAGQIAHSRALQPIAIVEQKHMRALFNRLGPGGCDLRGDTGQGTGFERLILGIVPGAQVHV